MSEAISEAALRRELANLNVIFDRIIAIPEAIIVGMTLGQRNAHIETLERTQRRRAEIIRMLNQIQQGTPGAPQEGVPVQMGRGQSGGRFVSEINTEIRAVMNRINILERSLRIANRQEARQINDRVIRLDALIDELMEEREEAAGREREIQERAARDKERGIFEQKRGGGQPTNEQELLAELRKNNKILKDTFEALTGPADMMKMKKGEVLKFSPEEEQKVKEARRRNKEIRAQLVAMKAGLPFDPAEKIGTFGGALKAAYPQLNDESCKICVKEITRISKTKEGQQVGSGFFDRIVNKVVKTYNKIRGKKQDKRDHKLKDGEVHAVFKNKDGALVRAQFAGQLGLGQC